MASPPLEVMDSIATPDEVDVFEVDLVGGVEYTAAVFGFTTTEVEGALPDPVLGVFDGDDNQIAFNDDLVGLDPGVRFTAPESGTYQVAVTGFDGTTGEYALVLDQTDSFLSSAGLSGEIA